MANPPVADSTYKPVGHLSDFFGQNSVGIWNLIVTDDLAMNPLVRESATLDLTGTVVPEPGAVMLFGVGFLVAGLTLRRERP